MAPRTRGRAVRDDPIKTTLKAPGYKRLKLKRDKVVSRFAFNFNLRRYIEAPRWVHVRVRAQPVQRHEQVADEEPVRAGAARVGRGAAVHLLQHVDVPPARGQGLHSSTFRLIASAFCGIGGAFWGCLWGVRGC